VIPLLLRRSDLLARFQTDLSRRFHGGTASVVLGILAWKLARIGGPYDVNQEVDDKEMPFSIDCNHF